jgi:hypothetical protein
MEEKDMAVVTPIKARLHEMIKKEKLEGIDLMSCWIRDALLR